MKAIPLLLLLIVLPTLVACQAFPPLLQAGPAPGKAQEAAEVQTSAGAETDEEAMLAQFAHPEALVTTDWLADHLNDANLRVVDVRFGGLTDYEAAHIPGAVHADLFLDLMTPDAEFVSVAPPADQFSATMQRLGIDNDTTVVAYDPMGNAMGAARLWWLLHYYGHDDVKLLNGGWTKWELEGRPTETGTVTPAPGTFTAGAPREEWRATIGDVEQAVDTPELALIDALPLDLFTGETPHEDPMRAGHIPTAKNLPAPDILDPTTMALLPRDELSQLWASLGVQDAEGTIVYCEAGVFSALDFFVLYQLGQEDIQLYETSLMEWGTLPDYPMELGEGSS
jgi:thiosulfate/3-mercaptopyruvate sulfurtransferase